MSLQLYSECGISCIESYKRFAQAPRQEAHNEKIKYCEAIKEDFEGQPVFQEF
jgi:hypothetical protein